MGCSIDFKHRYSVRFPLIWCECAIRLMENAQTWLKHFSVHLFFLLRMSFRCINCIAGTDFDLWTVNQIWSPVPCEKIYLWYPQKLSVKELSWQAVFTGCGCIYHVYHCIIRIIIYILTGWNCFETNRYTFTARMRMKPVIPFEIISKFKAFMLLLFCSISYFVAF